jgi:GT2 family glycosyltransferase
MELSIIYVNWNSLDYLRESIASVYQHTHNVVFEIIVVDNASPEQGVDSLKDTFPTITTVHSDKNLGFAGANNLGFKHSVGEYVLFLNPDTKLIAPSIDLLLARLRALPDAGIVGCKLLNTDLSVQLSSIQTYPTILNQAMDAEYLRLRWPECPLWKIAPLFSENVTLIKVDVIPGACMLLRRALFEQVGLFSEDYFMYAEDLDLNYKVKAAGFTNYYVGETAIIHHGGKSSSRQEVSHWATIMKYRAMVHLFRKTRGRVYAFGYRLAMGAVAIGRLVLLVLVSPFGSIVWDQKSLKFSLEKWKAVLKWAVGWQDVAVQCK